VLLIVDQSIEASKPNEKCTQRSSWQQRLTSNCTFKDIERISICDGGTPILVTKIALDHVEVAFHQDDSRGAPKTVSWRHEVCGVVAPFL
jgi:hypothetical protein